MSGYVAQQYENSSNLKARADLHARFSTNKRDWFRWVFEHLDLKQDSRVLEVGCGTGELWRCNLSDIPSGCEIVLSDLSPGMASEAHNNLVTDQRFRFCVCDAQQLPFSDRAYDYVVANHMLYHVPDRRRALGESWRVLKSGGRLLAAANGPSHMRELWEMVGRVSLEKEAAPAVGEEFTLQNGAAQLGEWFTDVSMTRRDDSLEVTDAGRWLHTHYQPTAMTYREIVRLGWWSSWSVR